LDRGDGVLHYYASRKPADGLVADILPCIRVDGEGCEEAGTDCCEGVPGDGEGDVVADFGDCGSFV
jgi:hypothetical protein